jgi:hypothetical protein
MSRDLLRGVQLGIDGARAVASARGLSDLASVLDRCSEMISEALGARGADTVRKKKSRLSRGQIRSSLSLSLSSLDLKLEEREREPERDPARGPPESRVRMVAAKTSGGLPRERGILRAVCPPVAGAGPEEPALSSELAQQADPVGANSADGRANTVDDRPRTEAHAALTAGARPVQPTAPSVSSVPQGVHQDCGDSYDWRAVIVPLRARRTRVDWDHARAKYDAWRTEKRKPDSLSAWLRFAGNEREPPMEQLELPSTGQPRPSHWAQDPAAYREAAREAVPMPDSLRKLLHPRLIKTDSAQALEQERTAS